jgi:anti-anti-sigma factor
MVNLPAEIFGDVAVVHLPDEVGIDQAAPVQQFLLNQERQNIVIDLDGVEAFDSSGLGMLLDVQDALREQHGNLKIATTNNVNKKVLEITRLDRQLEVFDSVIDAVKSFRE